MTEQENNKTIFLNKLRNQFLNKKVIILKVFLLIVVSFNSNYLNAQTFDTPLNCFLINNSPELLVSVEIMDTTTVSHIEVNLGISTFNDSLFSYTYNFDQSAGLPNNYTYNRNGFKITLGIGEIDIPPIVYSRIRLKYNNNIWSDWFQFISN